MDILNNLPAPNIIKPLDYEQILAAHQQAFLEACFDNQSRAAYQEIIFQDSSALNIVLQVQAYRELLLTNHINQAARSCMIAYAVGSDLDNLVANFNVRRLLIQAANDEVNPPLAAVYEDDEALRARALSAFHALSTAGPRSSYEFYAKSTSGAVLDAKALSPAPACVTVVILGRYNEGAVSNELLAQVEQNLSADNRRPIGDRVTVQAANIVKYQIKAKIYAADGLNSLATAVNDSAKQLARQLFKIGHNIPQSRIIAALHVPGVSKVELLEPATDLIIDDFSAPYLEAIDLSLVNTSN